jgi:hypothetical protein
MSEGTEILALSRNRSIHPTRDAGWRKRKLTVGKRRLQNYSFPMHDWLIETITDQDLCNRDGARG